LRRNNFHQLYSHQVEIREHVQQKKDVIITTPTSSGKSIGFQVPVLEKFLKSKTSAIYIFPLKALVADQVGKMYQLISKLPPSQRPKVWQVTGDIPEEERKRVLQGQQPDILICPPDILHWQLFKYRTPGWENWTRFLGRLETVILDEAHSYRGLFGGNMTNLIRRLRGIMDKINPGSSQRLQCIVASATVGNPLSLAQRLLSKQNQPDDIAWIKESGAPTNYHVYLTHVAAAFPKRAVAELVDKCIAAGLNGIVFTKTVLAAIELYNYITTAEKKDSQSQGGGNSGTLTFDSIIDRVTPYYASQSATLKATILRDFKEKKKKFLFATSALEAGVR
jgi:DEAD/DEAH box helicase domain-containing protein